MTAMKRPVGTWFEFQHPNEYEGRYWNDTCRAFTSEQWGKKVEEIASLGMKYLVLMNTSRPSETGNESYYPTALYPFARGMGCEDPLEALFAAADRLDMHVFVSCGFYGIWAHTLENMTSPEVDARAFCSMGEIYERYHAHPSFYGWYYPDETKIYPRFSDTFLSYVERYSAFASQLDASKKKLIAPYGTNKVVVDEQYVRQLEHLPVDIIAYQDEVGAGKSKPEETGRYFEALRRAHDKAGRSALWCDMEMFEFEGEPLRSPLIPAGISRIEKQLKSVSPYVDEVLIYQYQGLMNRPGTPAFCGHEKSLDMYNGYSELVHRIERERLTIGSDH